MISNRAESKYTNELKEYVADAKHNMNYKRQFMEWERQRAYDFDDGKKAGLEEGAINNAKTMILDKLPLEKVSKYSGLSIEEVKKLSAELFPENA